MNVASDLGATRVIGVCAIPEVEKRLQEAFLPNPKRDQPRKNPLFDFFDSTMVERLLRDLWPLGESDEPRHLEKGRKPPGLLRIFAQCIAIMENEINSLRLARDGADVLLRPELNGVTLLEFNKAEEIIRAGEEAARADLAAIRALVSH